MVATRKLQETFQIEIQVTLEKFKAIDIVVSHIYGAFRNHAKNKNHNLYEIDEK